ncbi:MAG: O-antigen ligase family protein [Patescibacteria group bacterium]|nr:O-antigen ligase family protein [Patescibacteria group bacterium]
MIKILKRYRLFFQEKYFIHFTIIFLIALCFNIDNKTIIAAAFAYLLLSVYILKSLSKGLIFTFLLFNLFSVGKTFEFILIPLSSLYYGHWIQGYQGYEDFIILGPSFFIGLLIAIWSIYSYLRNTISLDKYTKIFLVFLLLSFISALISLNPRISTVYWIYFALLLPFFLLLRKEVVNNKNFITDLLNFFSILVVYEGIWALFQYITKSSLFPSLVFFHNILIEGTDLSQNWFRPWGTFNHPNDLANFLLPLTIAFFLHGFLKQTINNKFIIPGFIFGLTGILLSLSRSSWLVLFLVTLPLTFIFEKKYKLSFDWKYMKVIFCTIILFIPIGIFLVLPRLQKSDITFAEGGSGLFRINQLSESVNLVMKYPLFGVGQGMSVLGMFLENPKGEMYYFPTPSHNMYLNLAEEIGLVPFFFFFVFLFSLLSQKIKPAGNKLLNNTIQGNIFLSSLISILLNGLFQPVYSTTMLYLLIFTTLYNYAQK